MITEHEIISTLNMIQNENLDILTITIGINLFDCASHDFDIFAYRVSSKIIRYATGLVPTCKQVEEYFGIPIINKCISVSPIGVLGASFSTKQFIKTCQLIDETAESLGVDFIGGYSALIEKGLTPGEKNLIESLPEALAITNRVCSSINVASSLAGINMDAVALMGKKILDVASATSTANGIGCTKLVVFSNIPQDIPFMAGAYLGVGEPDVVINVGVSGPGVIKKAIDRTLSTCDTCSFTELYDIIKQTAYKITRVGEIVGKEVASRLKIPFGIIDLSLAPTPAIGDSVGEIFQSMGLSSIGAPGSTAALAMLNDAIKKGSAFASSQLGGLSSTFIPVSEDSSIAATMQSNMLSLEKLEAMTSVCSVGLDMIAIPGDTPASTIAGIIADEMAIGVINKKTTAVRIIPVPGKKVGEKAFFGGLLGEATITPAPKGNATNFIKHGGCIPAPLSSLRN